MMKRKKAKKNGVNHFFRAWQKEYPNFYTSKLKKVLKKKDYVVSVSAGQGAYDPYPVYSATPFKMVKGKMKSVYGEGGVGVKGFKRLKGGKMFKDEVKARAYANKLLKKFK